MRAGCVVLASPVGAFPELIRDSVDGFLVPGSGEEGAAAARAADIILDCSMDPRGTDQVRKAARGVPWTAERAARTWIGHWEHLLGATDPDGRSHQRCPACGEQALCLTDGAHCRACGHFFRLAEPSAREADLPSTSPERAAS
jgi:hypothetical protein